MKLTACSHANVPDCCAVQEFVEAKTRTSPNIAAHKKSEAKGKRRKAKCVNSKIKSFIRTSAFRLSVFLLAFQMRVEKLEDAFILVRPTLRLSESVIFFRIKHHFKILGLAEFD